MKLKIEITFPKELKDAPIICNLCKNFDIVLNIVEASFSTEIGWAILILDGSEDILKKAIGFLEEKGLELKDTQQLA